MRQIQIMNTNFNTFHRPQRMQTMPFQYQMRYFSKKEDYEKGFDDFLNKGTVDDDKTKAEFKQRREEKDQQDAQKKVETEKMRIEDEKQKEKAFDDLVSGKAITDDMTLQDIFKKFYSSAKTVNVKEKVGVNKAMSSLNSFSERLEKRRQAAREAKQQAK